MLRIRQQGGVRLAEKRCRSCGARVSAEFRFCPDCGAELPRVVEQYKGVIHHQKQAPSAHVSRKPKAKRMLFAIVAGSLVGLAMIAFAVVNMSRLHTPRTYVSPPVGTSSPVYVIASAPRLQVALDYFGIKDPQQPPVYFAPNRIQLYVVVDDGITRQTFSYPTDGSGLPITEQFYLIDLGRQTVFHTSAVGNYLRISALAYSCADKDALVAIMRAMEAFRPEMMPLRQFYQTLPQEKRLIGWYEHTWTPVDRWGIGTHSAVGNDNLRLWLRIWSDSEPAVTPEPRFVPDVHIQSVVLPVDAKAGLVQYPINLLIMNNEAFQVSIRWEAHSSLRGIFDGGTITAQPRTVQSVKKYYFWEAGNRTITYKIYYKNFELDAWSGTLNIAK